jgi:hypothetical protein
MRIRVLHLHKPPSLQTPAGQPCRGCQVKLSVKQCVCLAAHVEHWSAAHCPHTGGDLQVAWLICCLGCTDEEGGAIEEHANIITVIRCLYFILDLAGDLRFTRFTKKGLQSRSVTASLRPHGLELFCALLHTV